MIYDGASERREYGTRKHVKLAYYRQNHEGAWELHHAWGWGDSWREAMNCAYHNARCVTKYGNLHTGDNIGLWKAAKKRQRKLLAERIS